MTARTREFRPVVLDGLPVDGFDAAVTYLADVLRECQLLLVDRDQGAVPDPAVVAVAEALVPDLEVLREVFRGAEIGPAAHGLRVETEMRGSDAELLARLQVNLVPVRSLGRQGAMLVASDPEVSLLLSWVWDELADQLNGREPRPFRRP